MGNGKFTIASVLTFITGHSEFTVAHFDWLLLMTTTSLNCIYLI